MAWQVLKGEHCTQWAVFYVLVSLRSLPEGILDSEIKCNGASCVYITCSFHSGVWILVGKLKLLLNFNCLSLLIIRYKLLAN